MLLQSVARPNFNFPCQTSGTPEVPAGTYGEPMTSQICPSRYSLIKAGKVFTASANNQSISSWVGATNASPAWMLFNPLDSMVDLVLLECRIMVMNTGGISGTIDFNYWSNYMPGAQAAIAGAGAAKVTNQYMYTLNDSSAYAIMGSLVLLPTTCNFLTGGLSVGATVGTAGLNPGIFVDDFRGGMLVEPGALIGMGATASTGANQLSISVTWAEVPT